MIQTNEIKYDEIADVDLCNAIREEHTMPENPYQREVWNQFIPNEWPGHREYEMEDLVWFMGFKPTQPTEWYVKMGEMEDLCVDLSVRAKTLHHSEDMLVSGHKRLIRRLDLCEAAHHMFDDISSRMAHGLSSNVVQERRQMVDTIAMNAERVTRSMDRIHAMFVAHNSMDIWKVDSTGKYPSGSKVLPLELKAALMSGFNGMLVPHSKYASPVERFERLAECVEEWLSWGKCELSTIRNSTDELVDDGEWEGITFGVQTNDENGRILEILKYGIMQSLGEKAFYGTLSEACSLAMFGPRYFETAGAYGISRLQNACGDVMHQVFPTCVGKHAVSVYFKELDDERIMIGGYVYNVKRTIKQDDDYQISELNRHEVILMLADVHDGVWSADDIVGMKLFDPSGQPIHGHFHSGIHRDHVIICRDGYDSEGRYLPLFDTAKSVGKMLKSEAAMVKKIHIQPLEQGRNPFIVSTSRGVFPVTEGIIEYLQNVMPESGHKGKLLVEDVDGTDYLVWFMGFKKNTSTARPGMLPNLCFPPVMHSLARKHLESTRAKRHLTIADVALMSEVQLEVARINLSHIIRMSERELILPNYNPGNVNYLDIKKMSIDRSEIWRCNFANNHDETNEAVARVLTWYEEGFVLCRTDTMYNDEFDEGVDDFALWDFNFDLPLQ
jgi:hypothetical protein